MHPNFEVLTPRWFKRAFVYTGSIGEFRYRFANDKENNLIHAAVYTHFCYEMAKDVQEQDFPWDEEGVEQLMGAAIKKGTPSGRRVSLFDSLQADLSDPGFRDQNSSFFRATYTPPVRAAAARQI